MNEIEQGIRDLIVQLNAARAENDRLRAAMQRIVSSYQENGWVGKEYNIARAALAQKGGE